MPKSVLQSNWNYWGNKFDYNVDDESIKLYFKLEKHGYDQVPMGACKFNDGNMQATVDFGKGFIDPSRLLGFMTGPWMPTLLSCLNEHQKIIMRMGKIIGGVID